MFSPCVCSLILTLIIRMSEYPPRADNAVSINTTDDGIGPSTVILSPFASLRVNSAKGLSRWASRCFAAAQHDRMFTPAASHGRHPERSEGSVALGLEMLRCGSA